MGLQCAHSQVVDVVYDLLAKVFANKYTGTSHSNPFEMGFGERLLKLLRLA